MDFDNGLLQAHASDVSNLMGSRVDDLFKNLHKKRDLMPSSFYSIDIDLAWISKKPIPHIAAWTDIKSQTEIEHFFGRSSSSGFSHVMMYNLLNKTSDILIKAPVFFIVVKGEGNFQEGNVDSHRFDVYLYMDGNHLPEPPDIEIRLAKLPWSINKEAVDLTWAELRRFEGAIRDYRRQEIRDAVMNSN